jgi:hypothetical protein
MITKHSEKVLPMSSGLLLPMSLDAHEVRGESFSAQGATSPNVE